MMKVSDKKIVEVWKNIKGYEGKYRVSNNLEWCTSKYNNNYGRHKFYKRYKWIFLEKRYDNGFDE